MKVDSSVLFSSQTKKDIIFKFVTFVEKTPQRLLFKLFIIEQLNQPFYVYFKMYVNAYKKTSGFRSYYGNMSITQEAGCDIEKAQNSFSRVTVNSNVSERVRLMFCS